MTPDQVRAEVQDALATRAYMLRKQATGRACYGTGAAAARAELRRRATELSGLAAAASRLDPGQAQTLAALLGDGTEGG